MKVCIIMPAYNEEKRIAKTLEEYLKFYSQLKKEKKIDFEILVIINNTKDRTKEIVEKYAKKHKELKFKDYKEGGKGFAIIEGFKIALKNDFDLIGFVDADNATSAESFYDLITNINNYDGIIASRYVKGAKVMPKQSIQRIIASRVFNFLIQVLFLIHYNDTQCGAKLFKRKTIEDIFNHLTITKWAFDVELLYLIKKKGYKVKEHATKWSDKEYSHINLQKAGARMVLAIIRLRLLESRFKWLIDEYHKLPKWMIVTHEVK